MKSALVCIAGAIAVLAIAIAMIARASRPRAGGFRSAGGVGGYIPLFATADAGSLAGQCMLPGECAWAT